MQERVAGTQQEQVVAGALLVRGGEVLLRVQRALRSSKGPPGAAVEAP